jgi:hypothetical protein
MAEEQTEELVGQNFFKGNNERKSRIRDIGLGAKHFDETSSNMVAIVAFICYEYALGLRSG